MENGNLNQNVTNPKNKMPIGLDMKYDATNFKVRIQIPMVGKEIETLKLAEKELDIIWLNLNIPAQEKKNISTFVL